MNKIFQSLTIGGTAFVMAVASFIPFNVTAQVLEEIVVTAQRREQSLQEVPISIETFSGDQLNEEGFRNMEDLSYFSPSIYIQSGIQEQRIAVRGFGTIGNSLTLEQAVPMFVDNIHYGRQSQIQTAFLDVERIEVLKGPQPVFFGQNATAGAFNIQSKRPTASWEGDVNATYGSNSSTELSFGVGGPINDTWGIRVAGIREESEGFLKDAVTGNKYPRFDHLGGRVVLQWTPNDNFQATSSMFKSRLRNGSEAVTGCITGGDPIWGRGGIGSKPRSDTKNNIGSSTSVYTNADATPFAGEGFDVPFANPITDDCFGDNVGWTNGDENGSVYLTPPLNIRTRANDHDIGNIDQREVAENFLSQDKDMTRSGPQTGLAMGGHGGKDYTDSWGSVLELVYNFDNGIEINSTSGFNAFVRNNIRDNNGAPFSFNNQARQEEFDQWSTEIRVTSPTGGTIEWMVGGSYQENGKDFISSSLNATVRRAQRLNYGWEDASWSNAFGTVTLNFLDDRASLDVGGRYQSVKKDVYITGFGAQYVFDIAPCDVRFLDTIDKGIRAGAAGADLTLAHITACDASVDTDDPSTMHSNAYRVSADDARIFVDGPVDMTNLWALGYDGKVKSSDKRRVPPNWMGAVARPVGLSAPDYAYRLGKETDDGAPIVDTFTDPGFDPQVTLRYRAGNHSLFARWAKASKAAGFDTGQSTLPANVDELKFEAETAQTWEFGSKGTLWDGRGRYDITIFRTDFTDLQLSGLAPISNLDSTSVATNAGKQRVEGIEFGLTAAVSDNLELNMSGAIMDGVVMDFQGSTCNFEEKFNTVLGLGMDLIPCDIDKESPGYETLDRSGAQAPRTPDWKFVLSTRYSLPFMDQYQLFFNTKSYYSDGLIVARDSFSQVVGFDTHGDMNISTGIRDAGGVWSLTGYANNIFEAKESYNPEFDAIPNGYASVRVSPGNFMTYGLRFNYKFR
jgi:outer membrane receptor protein involved in Fe transport